MITVVITILLHMEKRSTFKICGVLLATAGAVVVTWFSGGGTEGRSILLGSCFFFINCVSSSMFVVRGSCLFALIDRIKRVGPAVSCSLRDLSVVQCVLGVGDDRRFGDVWR